MEALRKDVAIASAGPVMTASLEAHGLKADIIPNHPKMGALVKAAAQSAAAVLMEKRSACADTQRSRKPVTPAPIKG